MTRLRGTLPLALLALFGTFIGVAFLEAGARVLAVRDERAQGRFDRDLTRIKAPSAGAVVTLGQIIQRSQDPQVIYELRPRLDVMFAGGRLTTSDAGFRGRDVKTPKPPGTLRIVGIGDSYMFGQGVSDDQTYMTALPSKLKDAWPERTVETVNLAVPGYNTAMEVALLKDRAATLQPDLLVVEIVGNDLDLPNFLWDTLDPWTMKRSFLLDFVRGRLRTRGDGLTEAPHASNGAGETFSRDDSHVPAQYASLVGLPAFDRSIDDLAAFARARSVPILAVTHGVWFEDEMLRALRRNSIPVLVLRSALRQHARSLGAPDYRRSPLAQSPDDLHPSALGHQVIAEELADWIPKQLPHL